MLQSNESDETNDDNRRIEFPLSTQYLNVIEMRFQCDIGRIFNQFHLLIVVVVVVVVVFLEFCDRINDMTVAVKKKNLPTTEQPFEVRE